MRVARSIERNAQRGELRGEVADADADHQPPARDLIDARQLLGQQHGLVQRQLQDAGGDGDRRRVRRRQRESDDGVEERDLGRDRVVGRLRAGEDEVLAGPQRVESGGLGVLRHSHQRVGIGAGPVVDRVEPELHGRTVERGVGHSVDLSASTSSSGSCAASARGGAAAACESRRSRSSSTCARCEPVAHSVM